ncbi:alpha/beta fold hydrolase [Plantactinospora sp. KBS50]|uniref:alpha/beta fold hydrolase n=1 Tax=Plantactinospora sp. KBS50 TaxID=2024580 RepID=UPI000BAABC3E|nr:alpha/beta hydrolase [Plantactinospora sp. KBS50]ASW53597.1 alpha/beta hydrolase [Plantactinospora sp. KBS50]
MSGAPARRRSGIPAPRTAVRAASIVGAAVGVAAAGVAAGIAAERAVVRRSKRVTDPYADEVFGPQPCEEEFPLRLPDGTDLHVEIVEAPAAAAAGHPTLVFVHGFCLDMGTFHFQRTALARRGGHRMVFYDQPGHGRSGSLRSGEYDLARLGDALREVVERTVPNGPLVLVGHSMGGMTIMALAERYPDLFGNRVVGTVLMATSAGRLRQTRLGVPAVLSRAGTPLLPILDNATRLSGGVLDRARRATTNVAWLLTRRYGFGTSRPSPALVSYVEEMNSHTSAETVARYLRTLYTHSRHPALAALAGTPTLVIVGDKDLITPPEQSAEIVRRLPDAQFVLVPESGHVVMLEHADVVNAALMDFLDRLEK